MSAFDVIVRGATVVAGAAPAVADIGIADERIAAIAPELEGGGAVEHDARGLLALPGAVDAHVHLNEPGRTAWEGFASGTRALAAGGTTTGIDMPLNAHPPTVDAAALDLKLHAARSSGLWCDVALWGGLVPGPPTHLERLDELAARGVVGFKAFMAASGIDDFPAADDVTLHTGMERAARLGLPVAVHAESDALTRALHARAVAEGRTTMRDFLASRPVEAELDAIARALAIAAETGCPLHVVHISTGRGVALIAEARARGVDVTCETCPHYLVLDEEDAERLGAVAKCTPPLRPAVDQEALWERLLAGDVDLVATDHSPSPPDLKRGDDALAWWGGISGAQTLLASVYDAAHVARGLPLARLAALLAAAPAARFLGGTARKGALAVGADADIALVDPAGTWTVDRDDLRDRHRLSPLAGRTLRGRVVRTLLHGAVVDPGAPPRGRVLHRDGTPMS